VLVATAVLLIALALVPGLPLLPFLLLGLVAAAAALVAARRQPRSTATADEPGAGTVRGPRLALRLSPALHARIVAAPAEVHALLAALREEAHRTTGVPIPPFAITRDPELAPDEAALVLDATPVAWFAAADVGALRTALPAALSAIVPDLLGVDRVAALVEKTAASAPVLVREVIPKLVSLGVLTEVLRGLARERLPVDDLGAVLEAVALAPAPAGGFTARDVPVLTEHLRGQLRRQISARWAPRGQLAVYTLDSMIEDAVRSAVDRREGVTILALEPAIAQDIVAAVKSALGDGPGVILTSGDVRRHLRGLLEPELPEIAVLAAHELAPGTQVRTAGRITV
jgi:type III secretion protein V